MDCTLDDRSRVIDDYLENRLADSAKDDFEAHYLECDDCFAELNFTKTLRDLIQKEGKALLHIPKEKKGIDWLKGILGNEYKKFRVPALGSAGLAFALYFLFFFSPQSNSTLIEFHYNEKVPLQYDDSAWRGGSTQAVDSLFDAFNDQFTTAMIEYNQLNYLPAENLLQKMQPAVELLQKRMRSQAETQQNLNKLNVSVRNYYLYRGLANLAIATKDEKTPSISTIQEALTYFNKAKAIPVESTVDRSRENYFIGLCHAFQNDKDESRRILKTIHPGEQFHKQSVKLLNQLGD
ncbi:MAG: hypothetical protein DWQ10_06640 [Calditrichaeota bacterium]|nr:MAG: hypothetical protein DWQ10_06640 [Calditrichota bacterium]